MSCQSCATDVPEGARFCPGCGVRLDESAPARPDAASALLSGDRRVVTVLISDLSGFTALGERLDPEAVADIMRTIKRDGTDIVEAHGGVVNQFIGDEIVSLFGLPTASDDDAQRAVAAALELHQRVERLNQETGSGSDAGLGMHSGIQTGLVIARVDDDRNGVYELTGDTINTAARLLSLAGKGEVLIGDETMNQLRGLIDVEDAGHHEVRGKALPIAAHRVLRLHPERGRLDAAGERGLTPFTARAGELERLRQAALSAFAGSGAAIVVEGDAGAGKSRLCHEFLQDVRARFGDLVVLQGRCQAYGTATPYLPFVQLVREAFGVERSSTVQVLHDLVPDAITRLSPSLGSSTPAYLHLLSATTIDQLPSDWRGDRLSEHLQRACVDLVRAVAARGPCIVKLDDWHWADSASRLTLTRLVEALGTIDALVLIAQRPTSGEGEARVAQRIELGALSPDQTAAMIRGHFSVDRIQDGLAERIHDHTNGNPFFVEEVCAALAAAGTTDVVDDCLVAAGSPDSVAIPQTVQAVVLGRIDALPAAPKQVLRVASVFGREFGVPGVRKLLPHEDVEAQLAELSARGLVEAMDADDGSRFRFRHVITQSVTYDSLLVRERSEVHRLIAAEIAAAESDDDRKNQRNVEALAHHHLGAGDHHRAIEYLGAAGDKARGRFAIDEARGRYRHALDVTMLDTTDAEMRRARPRLAVRWAEACVYAPAEDQIPLLQQALGEALEDGDLRHAALLGYWINWLQHSIGDQSSAEQGTRLMLSQMGDDDESDLGVALQSLLGAVLVASRQHDEAFDRLARGVRRRDAAYRSGDVSQASSGMHVYTLAQHAVIRADTGAIDEALEDGAYALAVTRAVGSRSTEGSVHTCIALAQTLAGRWPEVRATVHEIHQLDPVVVTGYVSRLADVLDSFAAIQLGAAQGIERLVRSVENHRRADQRFVLCLSEALLADAFAELGQHSDARAHARMSLDRRHEHDIFGEDIAEATLLRVSALAGEELDARVAEVLASPAIACSPRSTAIAELAAGHAYVSAGAPRSAQAYLDSAVETMERLGLGGWLERARRTRESIGASTAT